MTGFDIKDIPTINIGNVGINSVYVGNVLVWGGSGPTPPVHDYEQDYFTTVGKGSGDIIFDIESGLPTSVFSSISYSIDGGETWTTTNNVDNQRVTVTVPVKNGDKVLWKGTGSKMTYNITSNCNFSGNINFDVEGNIMSLINGDNFYHSSFDPNVDGYIFCGLFNLSSQLINANNLVLSATTLKPYCYSQMFYHCSNLASVPELPATTLAEGCYSEMFKNSSMTTAQSTLPATTLAAKCYKEMFVECSNLTTAPVLPAATLTQECYWGMFADCTSLNYIKMLATDISAYYCLGDWVGNVAATGTFVKNASMTTLPTGDDGIPTGWTVEDDPSTLLSTITAE